MFGMFKKPIERATLDLEDCINYLSNDLYSIHFIYDEIERGSKGVINGDFSLKECEEFWTDVKNHEMFSKNLRNHRDIDFCRAYILICFFFICRVYSTPDRADAVKRMQKILDFLSPNYPTYERKLNDIITSITDEKATRAVYNSKKHEEMKKIEKLAAEQCDEVIDDTQQDDEMYYEIVAEELESGDIQKGLWAKAFALQNGEENATKAAYIQMRVEQLMLEEPEDHKTSDGSSTDLSGWLPKPYIRN